MYIQIQRDHDRFFLSSFEKFERVVIKRLGTRKGEVEIVSVCVNTDLTCNGKTNIDDWFDGISSEEIGQILGGN